MNLPKQTKLVHYNNIHKLEKIKLREKVLIKNIIIILAITVVSAGIVYGTIEGKSKINKYEQSLVECNNIRNKYEQIGIKSDTSLCEKIQWNNAITVLLKPSNIETIEEQFEKIRLELENKINIAQKDNAKLSNQLNGLEVEHKQVVNTISEIEDLNEKLKIEMQNQKTLKKLIEKNNYLVAKAVSENEKIINEYFFIKSEKLIEHKNKLIEFKQYSKEEQYIEYKRLERDNKGIYNVITEELNKNNILTDDVNIEDFFRYKYFTSDEFVTLLSQLHTTESIIINVNSQNTYERITGNEKADSVIFKIAEERGYIKRIQANENNLITIESYHKGQRQMTENFIQMRSQAKKEGVDIELVSAYRDTNSQKNLFLKRFYMISKKMIGRNYTSAEIINGNADKALNITLQVAAPPGYSKHHGGYTIDIKDANSVYFGNSEAFEWISKNNYLNAKKFGFLPSYPSTDKPVKYGPNPETWEYIWAGNEYVKY